MSVRLLISGAGGFVAGSIIRQAPSSWEVHAVSRSAAPIARSGLTWHSVDPLDSAVFEATFRTIRPTAVIHTAAAADIDFCQANQELARRINVDLVARLAGLCEASGARLVHLSTDNVFDGGRGLYREDDKTEPVNFYGQTKAEAETAVASLRNAVVARVALVMGLPMIGAGNSFLSRMRQSWAEGKKVGVPSSEVRSPVDVVTLGRALLELAGSDFTGTVHLAGNEVMNRYEMAERIAVALGYSKSLVVANDPADIPGRAPRPRDVSMDNSKARCMLSTPMLDLEESLVLVLETAEALP